MIGTFLPLDDDSSLPISIRLICPPKNNATHSYIPTPPCHFVGVDDHLLPKIGGETAQVTGRADKAWAVAHYYVARLMIAAVGGGKITPAQGFTGVE